MLDNKNGYNADNGTICYDEWIMSLCGLKGSIVFRAHFYRLERRIDLHSIRFCNPKEGGCTFDISEEPALFEKSKQ